jgi:protoporphyrin/coproporphyrin ferrochelatase
VSAASRPTGVLLAQLGTPDSTRVADVRRYLREFLSDPRVLDIPGPARWLLLHAVILPFRPRRSAAAYRAIWTPEGSPLLVHGRALAEGVSKALGPGFCVELGMRYGTPAIPDALGRLLDAGADRVIVLPLFPQYAASSTGSALERVLAAAASRWNVPEIVTLGAFYEDPGFVAAVADRARPVLEALQPDHVLLSFHGLPERHVRKSDASGGDHCLARATCCDAIVAANRHCYRAQCFATSRALVAALGLRPEETTTAFQSRLGRTPWIRPYTDEVLAELARRGVRRLAVLCPSFVADCLETLEEIGIRGREQWRTAGGEELALVPCPNASPAFVEAVAGWIREAA